jgi:hypothetical protein
MICYRNSLQKKKTEQNGTVKGELDKNVDDNTCKGA